MKAFLVKKGFVTGTLLWLASPLVQAMTPACTAAAVNVQNGWGWENNASCRAAVVSVSQVCIDSPPLGDGWGWDGVQSCRLSQDPRTNDESRARVPCLSPASDDDGDGFGWENSRSCVVVGETENAPVIDEVVTDNSSRPVCIDDSSDPDGDGFGWENLQSCVVAAPPEIPTQEVTPPTVVVDSTPSLTLRNSFGSQASVESATRGNFAVLWDNTFDHRADGKSVLQILNSVRDDVLGFGLKDPSPVAEGYYYNTYIHHGSADSFPVSWGNSPLISDGIPYLVLWHGVSTNLNNLYHESFHVFQPTRANSAFSPGLESDWYKEASAIWYAADKAPDHADAFKYSELIRQLPHLALWHSYSNKASTDPRTWSYLFRSHGISTFLFHLDQFDYLDKRTLLEGYKVAGGLSVQQYLLQEIGVETMRNAFVDWVASVIANPAYISKEQKKNSMAEILLRADPAHLHPYAVTIGPDSFGDWMLPEAGLEPRGWGFNVVRVVGVEAGDMLQVSFEGEAIGREGSTSNFALRSIVSGAGDDQVTTIDTVDGINAISTIEIPEGESELSIVVVALPDQLKGHQNYPYALKIDKLE